MIFLHSLFPVLYQGAVFLLTLYGLFILISLGLFFFHRKQHDWPQIASRPDQWPAVTIQIPIYNEREVAARVVQAVAALDYPADKLQIQVLDDSTDRTSAILARLIGQLRRTQGVAITHIHRKQRHGYKAGALSDALSAASGEYIAIFDADFQPRPNWLKQTIPAMVAHPELAFIQTRWGHQNRSQNIITAAQALALDGHFVVEQQARSASGFMQNFNGSGGLWRRAAIEDAGGWESDTVTEDLDLAYRAQLAGWRGGYINAIEAPAELPPVITGFRRQQRRWAKGSAQTFRKLWLPVLHSQYSLPQRLYALTHMGGYAFHIPVLIMLALTPFLALLSSYHLPLPFIGGISMIFSVAPFIMFALAQVSLAGWRGLRRLWALPILAILFMGLSPAIALSVIAGFSKSGGVFERTPKQGRGPRQSALPQHLPLRGLLPEMLVFSYAVGTLMITLFTAHWELMPLPALLLLGTALALTLELQEYRSVRRQHHLRRTSRLARSGDIPSG